MQIQARIPPALAAMHNFILDNDPTDIDYYLRGNSDDNRDENPGVMGNNDFGTLSHHAVTAAEKEVAGETRNRIAQAMYNDYLRVCAERAAQIGQANNN